MGFNLLAFAGGAAKGLTEEIDKAEEEAKTYATASTKLMYDKYNKLTADNKELISAASNDLDVIRANFKGKASFTPQQEYQIMLNKPVREQLVKAANDKNIDLSTLNASQIIKMVEDNTPGTAKDRLEQAYAIPKILDQRAKESEKTFGGFMRSFGERAGETAAQKVAATLGVPLEQMRGAMQPQVAPKSTAEFDLSTVKPQKTAEQQLSDLQSKAVSATDPAERARLENEYVIRIQQLKTLKEKADPNYAQQTLDQRAKAQAVLLNPDKFSPTELDEAKAFNKTDIAERLRIETALHGNDTAKMLEQKRAKTSLVLSEPKKYTPAEVAEAKAFNSFELNQARIRADMVRKEPEEKGVDRGLIAATFKAVSNTMTYGTGDQAKVYEPTTGKRVRAESPEGARIIAENTARAIKEVLTFRGDLNADGSFKNKKDAATVMSSNVPVYLEGDKAFIGVKPVKGSVSEKPTAPAEAITELKQAPTEENKKFFKETFGYLPEGILETQPTTAVPQTPAKGFATKPTTTIEDIESAKTKTILPIIAQFKKAEQDYLTALKAGGKGDIARLVQIKEDLRKQAKAQAVQAFGENEKVLSTYGM